MTNLVRARDSAPCLPIPGGTARWSRSAGSRTWSSSRAIPRAAPTALTQGTTSVGRDPRCDIVLPYSTVSWHHASIIKRGDVIAVHDLGSRNGTFVGLEKVDRRELAPGDVIRFGDRVALELVYLEIPRPT